MYKLIVTHSSFAATIEASRQVTLDRAMQVIRPQSGTSAGKTTPSWPQL